MQGIHKKLFTICRYITLWIIVLFISGCTVHLISDYNATLVNQLQAMQKQINVILLSVQENIGGPKAHYQYYQK